MNTSSVAASVKLFNEKKKKKNKVLKIVKYLKITDSSQTSVTAPWYFEARP